MMHTLSLSCGKHPRARSAGFTLLELIIAVAVVTTGVVGTVTLLAHSVASAQAVRNEVTASNLAQEALEIVHNIRDYNVVTGGSDAWNSGMTLGTVFSVDANAPGLENKASEFLNQDVSGFYTYSGGTKSQFKRSVSFSQYASQPTDQALKVTIVVTWLGRTFTAESVITAWE